MKYKSVYNKYTLTGFLCLFIGSLSLFACKLGLVLWLELVFIVSGSVIILFGNGYILYGILTNVDEYRPELEVLKEDV